MAHHQWFRGSSQLHTCCPASHFRIRCSEPRRLQASSGHARPFSSLSDRGRSSRRRGAHERSRVDWQVDPPQDASGEAADASAWTKRAILARFHARAVQEPAAHLRFPGTYCPVEPTYFHMMFLIHVRMKNALDHELTTWIHPCVVLF